MGKGGNPLPELHTLIISLRHRLLIATREGRVVGGWISNRIKSATLYSGCGRIDLKNNSIDTNTGIGVRSRLAC